MFIYCTRLQCIISQGVEAALLKDEEEKSSTNGDENDESINLNFGRSQSTHDGFILVINGVHSTITAECAWKYVGN